MRDSSTALAGSDVVVCFCESDADYCRAFAQSLDSLRSQQVITSWREHRVSPENGNLPPSDSFQVVVALLSPEFLATGFLQREELLARMKGYELGSVAVIPVVVRPVEGSASLSDSVRPPADSRPLSECDDMAAAVEEIIARVRAVTKGGPIMSAPMTIDRTLEHPMSPSSAPTMRPPARQMEARIEPQRPADAPERIGRYKIISILGQGAFGAVYLAKDEELNRSVAIKMPHPRRITKSSDVESYMREARMVAQLDHPSIVPVYDVGNSEDGQFFVVSKVIEGKDLARRLRNSRPSLIESARIVALAAEALHYAHQRDMVHRDVKPANILIGDSDGRPYVADFGLAIHEDELGRGGAKRAGTPAYMSPEQARGESHRVDGRSDVYSLGVVLYELITGRLPFRNENIEELLQMIAKAEARPPRQFEPSIPRELERICLKAMSNRMVDRYTTAQDFADDLWCYIDTGRGVTGSGFAPLASEGGATESWGGSPTALESAASGWSSSAGTERIRRSSGMSGRDPSRSSRRMSGGQVDSAGRQSGGSKSKGSRSSGGAAHASGTAAVASAVMQSAVAGEELKPAKVVAKGLRAFDSHDADFFLQLVPGPRDRFGLPDIIRFWKSRLEERNSEKTFPVGVIYGPSGCGKTSLVQAGLVPQLAPTVHTMFLDATAQNTETRLAQRVKQLCSDASPDADLPALMAWIRRGRGLAYEDKLVIVIDQFEQWLQAHENDRTGELLDALRQCDGVRVQCVLMVRVDFMMSIHRFMNDLEAPIREGTNSAPVDLFDAMHAKKVLRLFGESYGRLPEDPAPLEPAQQAFIDSAVAELGPEGKIIPVHLALFADMCKGKPWRLETLKSLGGARGVGVTFLEETFDSSTAPLEHRLHAKGCRAVLASLLPDLGSDIRGRAVTRGDLAKAAGYKSGSAEFDQLLGVLDRDTRLITPIEQEAGLEAAAPIEGNGQAVIDHSRYQLTHDYLVPSLRTWLTKKQRETAKGRAEIKLDEFTRLWNDRPVTQRLPGLTEWFSMRTLTKPVEWTPPQRKMMRAAGRRIGMITATTAAMLVALAWAGVAVNNRFQANRVASTVDRLAAAPTAATGDIITELEPMRSAAAPLLLTKSADEQESPTGRVNAALAALSLDAAGDSTDKLVDQVYGAMIQAPPDDVAVMTENLSRYSDTLGDRAGKALAADNVQAANVLPLASVVAAFKPKTKWQPAAREAVAQELVTAPADAIGGWTRQLRPARAQLADALETVYTDANRPVIQRGNAGDLLVAFAPEDESERVKKLVALLENAASIEQFNRIVKELEPMAKTAGPLLASRFGELDKLAAAKVGVEREATGRKQMHLAAGLLQLAPSPEAWGPLAHIADPTVRSLLVEHAHDLGIPAKQVVDQLKAEKDVTVRRALVLMLGNYGKNQLEGVDLADVNKTLESLVADKDAGLHEAAAWLANRWAEEKIIPAAVQAAARPEKDALAEKLPTPTWYTTGQGQDMVVLRGPIEFAMGAPENDPDREGGAFDETELRHPAKIGRSYAISAKEVTAEQFLKAWAELKARPEFHDADGKVVDNFPYRKEIAPDPNCPVNQVDWFKALAYCNWLSEQEGIPRDQWCYRTEKEDFGYKHQMILPKESLARTGYRLPTEAEWEYACRAGATSGRFFGEAPSLLTSYAWYLANGKGRSWPVGSLKPNDNGLFDMYGNVSEWCLDEPRKYTNQPYDDVSAKDMAMLVDIELLRSQRGGGFQYVPQMVTSAARDRSDPDYVYFSIGLRVARTLPDTP